MIEFVWDLSQQKQIGEAKASAADAKSRTAEQGTRIQELEFRVERLALACQAMWEILRETTGLTDAQLTQKIGEIDLRDGKKDGRMKARPVTCPSCGRTGTSRGKKCIYCGSPLSAIHAFE
ncbi:MAG: hypothetical protein SFU53_09975 [Terrimicrobiaceae bacterium]|nr:hypothetical protein [Terrimicrobiaceae bacterium]